MAATQKKPYVSKKWRCSHCNRTASSSVKPGGHYGGPCHSAKNGIHTWIRES